MSPIPRWVYTLTRSRTWPPNRRHTGKPTDLPNMSHNAISMPEIAEVPMTPSRQQLDVAGIAADDERFEVLDGAIHRPGLPLQCRFTPPIEPVDVRIDPHEDPIAHLRVHDPCAHTCYSHRH